MGKWSGLSLRRHIPVWKQGGKAGWGDRVKWRIKLKLLWERITICPFNWSTQTVSLSRNHVINTELKQSSNADSCWHRIFLFTLAMNKFTRGCYPRPNLTTEQELVGKVELKGTLWVKDQVVLDPTAVKNMDPDKNLTSSPQFGKSDSYDFR